MQQSLPQEKIKETIEVEVKTEDEAPTNVVETTLVPQMPSKKEKRVPLKTNTKLYTINSNVKVGDKRYNVTKIVEANSEKQANIVYDKMVKVSLGRIKSSVKRTCKLYEEDDEEFCEEIIEEVKTIEETDPEIIELNKKLDYLRQSKSGFTLYEVTFSKNVIGRMKDYLWAENEEECRDFINYNIEENLKNEEDDGFKRFMAQDIKNSIKSIRRMEPEEIRRDKGALKKINAISLEDVRLGAMFYTDEEIQDLFRRKITKLIKRGFRFFQLTFPNEQPFVEFAPDSYSATLIALCEDRAEEKGLDERAGDEEFMSQIQVKEFEEKESTFENIKKFAVEGDFVSNCFFQGAENVMDMNENIGKYVSLIRKVKNVVDEDEDDKKENNILCALNDNKEKIEEALKSVGKMDFTSLIKGFTLSQNSVIKFDISKKKGKDDENE